MKILSFFVPLLLLLGSIFALPACQDTTDYTEISPTVYSILYDSVFDRYGNRIVYADYPLTVDETSGQGDTVLVYNVDSLPYQSDVSRAKLTVSTSATVYQEMGPDQFQVLQNDSVDCRRPVILRAVGNDKEGNILHKVLKLEIRIHTFDTDSVSWTEYPGVPDVACRLKTLLFAGRVYLFTEEGSIYSAPADSPGAWRTETAPAGLDYRSATVFSGRLYLAAGGAVYVSADGSAWARQENLSADGDVETLLGATSGYLAGVKGGLYCSTQGNGWKTGGPADGFVRTGTNSCVYALSTNSSIEQIALLGRRSDEALGRHCLLSAEDSLLNWGVWGPVDSAGYYLPFSEDHEMIRYGDADFYVFGGTGDDAFTYYYTSKGLYWDRRTNYTFFPEAFRRRSYFSAFVDEEHYIWVLFASSGRGPATLFRGRLNSYSL